MKAPASSKEANLRRKTRILIIDDQPIVREGLISLIGTEEDLIVCGEADNPHEGMELIAAEDPDLLITGLSFKRSHGLGWIKDLRARFPRLCVLVFSIYDEVLYGERVIRAGARGFVEKRTPTKDLLLAIRQVLTGEVYLGRKVATVTLRRFLGRPSLTAGSPLEQLSDRELEVLQLIGRGRSTRQIAAALGVDVKTVETYRGRIKVKLKLADAAELLAQAKRYVERAYSVRL
jgi:DNA-binding NarL/FixJ family response regulator